MEDISPKNVKRGVEIMIYKEFQGLKLSALGMGTMRLPVKGGISTNIDEEETGKMVAYAMDHGVNYFDTAWGYHDGQSEPVMGKILSGYPRNRYYLATKFPGYDSSTWTKVEEIFEEQLRKCRVEYFDFYLVHNVCELNIDAYLDPKYGILDYLLKQKENGRIRHLGFSVHGSYEVMKRYLEAYGKQMEFCQIQLNYLDWSFQNAKAKVELAQAYQLPVWVMEPLRGGSLCKLSEEHESRLKAYRPEEKIPAWAFRFLLSIPGVTMILSGMSNYEQMVENIQTFEEEKRLSREENTLILSIAQEMLSKKILSCTACRYCTSHCPQELDIPTLLGLYNEHSYTGGGFIAPMVLFSLPKDKRPRACIGCRSCEEVCPQQLKISEAMADFAKKVNM